jgi:hypothetical protein
MQPAEPSPGEAWAYRARQADPLVEVVAMKVAINEVGPIDHRCPDVGNE